VPNSANLRSVRENLDALVENLYLTGQIQKPERLKLMREFRKTKTVRELTAQLYGPNQEVLIPGTDAKLARLTMREAGKRRFSLFLILRGASEHSPRRKTSPLRCLVGHRFSPKTKQAFRWNVRELLQAFDVKEDYSDFDGAAIDVLPELRRKIETYDFCLFDNRETSKPSKPNVYIEAGMAYALGRPFILCHYKREVWPSDFANVLYISYRSYADLFRQLGAQLPLFIANRVASRTGLRSVSKGSLSKSSESAT
jgi:hypothetical protein